MLIDKSTPIEDLRFYKIIENWAFNIYHDRGIMTVEDILNCEDNAFPEIKDYIVRSLKGFLKQVIDLTEAGTDSSFKNPQVEDAYAQTLQEDWAVDAQAQGRMIFKSIVDVVSFLQIGTDEEYDEWLKNHGLEMQAEMASLETTYMLLKGIRDKIFAVNKFNLYIRLFDYVLSINRFREVERKLRAKTFRQNRFNQNPGRPSNRFGNDRFANNRQNRWENRSAEQTMPSNNWPGADNAQPEAPAEIAVDNRMDDTMAESHTAANDDWNRQNGNNRDFFNNRGFNNGRNNGNGRFFNDNRRFNEGRMNGNFRNPNDNFFDNPAPRFNKRWDDMERKENNALSPIFNEGGIVESDGTWNPRMFNRLTNFLKKSNSPDLIRLTNVSGINDEPADNDDQFYTEARWAELESRRRYLDSVNRGLGLPNNDQLTDLLQSTQWKSYDFYQLHFITRNNLDVSRLLEKEQVNINFSTILFFIALVKGMAMVNLKVDIQVEDDKKTNIYSCLVPEKFAGFSYTSFIAVVRNRMLSKDKEEVVDGLDDLFEHSLSSRYWKNGTLASQDSELFLKIIKGITSDILGLDLTVDEQAFKEKIERDEQANLAKALEEEKKNRANVDASARKGKGGRPVGSKTKGVLNIADAIRKAIEDNGIPMTREELVEAVVKLKPGTKESSISTIMATCHAKKELDYYAGGIVGIGGVDYGDGYVKINRMPKRSSSLA